METKHSLSGSQIILPIVRRVANEESSVRFGHEFGIGLVARDRPPVPSVLAELEQFFRQIDFRLAITAELSVDAVRSLDGFPGARRLWLRDVTGSDDRRILLAIFAMVGNAISLRTVEPDVSSVPVVLRRTSSLLAIVSESQITLPASVRFPVIGNSINLVVARRHIRFRISDARAVICRIAIASKRQWSLLERRAFSGEFLGRTLRIYRFYLNKQKQRSDNNMVMLSIRFILKKSEFRR